MHSFTPFDFNLKNRLNYKTKTFHKKADINGCQNSWNCWKQKRARTSTLWKPFRYETYWNGIEQFINQNCMLKLRFLRTLHYVNKYGLRYIIYVLNMCTYNVYITHILILHLNILIVQSICIPYYGLILPIKSNNLRSICCTLKIELLRRN